MYLDEGNYVSWAKLFVDSPGFAYVSMQDGKTPLFMWLIAWVKPWFGSYLLTGRLISVASGTISLFVWAIILQKTFAKNTGWQFLILGLITPYFVLIDRLAFVDSLMAMFASISMLGFVIGKKHWWGAILAGLGLGFGFYAKSAMKLVLIVQSAIATSWKSFIVVLIALLMFKELQGYMRIGAQRFWGMIAAKETQLVFSPRQVFQQLFILRDFKYHKQSFQFFGQYLLTYLGPMIFLIIIGTTWDLKKSWWLGFYAVAICGAVWLVSKLTASRYYYPGIYPLVALGALGARRLWSINRLLVLFIWTLLFYQSAILIFNPSEGLYASDDKANLVTSDANAYGLHSVINQIKNKYPISDVVVGVSGLWGVTDGIMAEMQSYNIKTVRVDQWLDSSRWGALFDRPEKYKYWYILGDAGGSVEELQAKIIFRNTWELPRPHAGIKAYLFELFEMQFYHPGKQ